MGRAQTAYTAGAGMMQYIIIIRPHSLSSYRSCLRRLVPGITTKTMGSTLSPHANEWPVCGMSRRTRAARAPVRVRAVARQACTRGGRSGCLRAVARRTRVGVVALLVGCVTYTRASHATGRKQLRCGRLIIILWLMSVHAPPPAPARHLGQRTD